MLLIDAGGDTTRNLVAGGLDALFDHPRPAGVAPRADLDGRLHGAVEELLRWISPVVYMRRTAACDTTLADVAISEGDKVVMYYGSANRDEAVFGAHRRTSSTCPGRTTTTSRSAAVDRTSASAPTSPASRSTPCSARSSPASRTSRRDGDTEWLPSTFISGPKHLPVAY